nr:cell envelope integrity TolA C-terminal domain-containing protein [Klebsiella pneumoniae]
MFEPEAYAGKCTVRISIQRDGTLNSAIAEGGDPKLCKAATISRYPRQNSAGTG